LRAQAVGDRHEEQIGEQRAVQRGEQRNRHRATNRAGIAHRREHLGQADQRADHAHRGRDLGSAGPDVGGGDVALYAGTAAVLDERRNVGRRGSIDDRGDRGGDVGIGNDRAIERHHAVALGDSGERGDLLKQRVRIEPTAGERRDRNERAAEIAERGAEDDRQRGAATDDGERCWVEKLGKRDHVRGVMQGVCRIGFGASPSCRTGSGVYRTA